MVMLLYEKFEVGKLWVQWVKKIFLFGLNVSFCWVESVSGVEVGVLWGFSAILLDGDWGISGSAPAHDLPRLTMVSRVKSQVIAGFFGDLKFKSTVG